MAGHNPHPQAETLQATSSESSETLSAFALRVYLQVLEDYLVQAGLEQLDTSDSESEPTLVPVTPVAQATQRVPESTPPKKVRRFS